MSKRWFDLIGLIIFAIVIFNALDNQILTGSDFVPVFIYLIIYIALRIFFFGYQKDSNAPANPAISIFIKKLFKLILYLVLFGALSGGAFYLWYEATPINQIKAEHKTVSSLLCVDPSHEDKGMYLRLLQRRFQSDYYMSLLSHGFLARRTTYFGYEYFDNDKRSSEFATHPWDEKSSYLFETNDKLFILIDRETLKIDFFAGIKNGFTNIFSGECEIVKDNDFDRAYNEAKWAKDKKKKI